MGNSTFSIGRASAGRRVKVKVISLTRDPSIPPLDLKEDCEFTPAVRTQGEALALVANSASWVWERRMECVLHAGDVVQHR